MSHTQSLTLAVTSMTYTHSLTLTPHCTHDTHTNFSLKVDTHTHTHEIHFSHQDT